MASGVNAEPREATNTGNSEELAKFLNKSRVEPDNGDGSKGAASHVPIPVAAAEAKEGEDTTGAPPVETIEGDAKQIICGPLLNYRRMEGDRWFGSALIVTSGGGKEIPTPPTLIIRKVGTVRGISYQSESEGQETNGVSGGDKVTGSCLYSDPRATFWQFDLAVPQEDLETKWEYFVPELHYKNKDKPTKNVFFVPSVNESMRIMFHSCNGFSVGTDEEAYCGPALWNDVMRRHTDAPFHVMIGGGDQIYNDGIRVNGPLKTWTGLGNPRKRHEYPFTEKLRAECDDYYLKNYLRWYDTGAFATANGQIAQLNIWDDHDIIDGFGSYVDSFMKCDVFRGIGGTAHKYYMLFQHHLPPPPSTYTSDQPQTMSDENQGKDPNQLADTYVAPKKSDPSYIVGNTPGPYVAEHSYNIYAKLGARMCFLGIDARTERTQHQINYPDTYNLIFERLRTEMMEAEKKGKPFKHLILLLGIPIAYPRLTWLENILRSPLIGPIKFLNRRFGLGGGIFNHFDGSVDLLDDLDDHYTARIHKKERLMLMERLQMVASEFSCRVTILGGDVHLAAVGRFYSNLHKGLLVEHDHRYMANIVSSAITNKPPPAAIANLLSRRNKVHHLNHDTDETLLYFFDKDPGSSNKTANHNKVTMPSRNYAAIIENSPNTAAEMANGDAVNGTEEHKFPGKDGHEPLHLGEMGTGTQHKAASKTRGLGNDGSLDVAIFVEIDQHDPEGHTDAYGLSVPLLDMKTAADAPTAAP